MHLRGLRHRSQSLTPTLNSTLCSSSPAGTVLDLVSLPVPVDLNVAYAPLRTANVMEKDTDDFKEAAIRMFPRCW